MGHKVVASLTGAALLVGCSATSVLAHTTDAIPVAVCDDGEPVVSVTFTNDYWEPVTIHVWDLVVEVPGGSPEAPGTAKVSYSSPPGFVPYDAAWPDGFTDDGAFEVVYESGCAISQRTSIPPADNPDTPTDLIEQNIDRNTVAVSPSIDELPRTGAESNRRLAVGFSVLVAGLSLLFGERVCKRWETRKNSSLS